MAANFDPAASNSLQQKPRSPLGDFIRNFVRNRAALAGFFIVLILMVVGGTGYWFTVIKAGDDQTRQEYRMFDPNKTELRDQLMTPNYRFGAFVDELESSLEDAPAAESTEESSNAAKTDAPEAKAAADKADAAAEAPAGRAHPLGTDEMGRDVMLRLWSGSTYSLLVGLLAVGISVFIGVMVGGIAGFYGREHTRLPFMLTLFLPFAAYIVGGVASLGLLATILSYLLYAGTGGLILMQIALAAKHGFGRSVALFLIALLVASAIQFYPRVAQSGDALGESLIAAEAAQDAFDDLIAANLPVRRLTDEYERIRENALAEAVDAGKQVDVDENEVVKRALDRAMDVQAEYRLALNAYELAAARYQLAAAESRVVSARELAAESEAALEADPPEEELAGMQKALASQKKAVAAGEAGVRAAISAIETKLTVRVALMEALLAKDASWVHGGELESVKEAVEAGVEPRFVEDLPAATYPDDAAKKAAEQQLVSSRAAAIAAVESIEVLEAKDVRTQIYNLRKGQAAYRAQVKSVHETLAEQDLIYKYSRNIVVLILSIMLVVVAFLFVVRAAQVASLESRTRKFFVPIMTIDNFVMRGIEVLMTMPQLFLLLTVLAVYSDSRSIWLVMFIIGITSWMGTARFVRAEILSLREREFIQAARALGLRDGRIIVRHLVPNALSPVLVSATIGVAGAILLESTLSFLGLGAANDEVTWGKMLSDGRRYITTHPYLMVIPGIAIFVVVLAFNLLGEGLREAMNPKLRKR